jgi:hypothetical protein
VNAARTTILQSDLGDRGRFVEDDRSMLTRRRRANNVPDEVLAQVADGGDRAMLVLQYATALLAAVGAILLAGFR